MYSAALFVHTAHLCYMKVSWMLFILFCSIFIHFLLYRCVWRAIRLLVLIIHYGEVLLVKLGHFMLNLLSPLFLWTGGMPCKAC